MENIVSLPLGGEKCHYIYGAARKHSSAEKKLHILRHLKMLTLPNEQKNLRVCYKWLKGEGSLCNLAEVDKFSL